MKQKIIPFFLGESGCPGHCIYCNQALITGQDLSPSDVSSSLSGYLDRIRTPDRPFEFAFFGGSFSALPESLARELLSMVRDRFRNTNFRGIRFSTRPDCLSDAFLELSVEFKVITIELGVQSFDDRVLYSLQRNYTSSDAVSCLERITSRRIETGVQLLIGSPGETLSTHRINLRTLSGIRPGCLRIYPLLVLAGTPLEKSFLCGDFQPLTLDQAIRLAVLYMNRLEQSGIRIIKIGLQTTPTLKASVVSGPWHESFGDLCRSCRFSRQAIRLLRKKVGGTLIVNNADVPLLLGHEKHGYRLIVQKLGYPVKYKINNNQAAGKPGLE
ncbi:MAG: radical SAM protein [Candidatus Wallbacteria bacterium]|nr:radical SAM protein [Candidatus Wallbacteria bacterium]